MGHVHRAKVKVLVGDAASAKAAFGPYITPITTDLSKPNPRFLGILTGWWRLRKDEKKWTKMIKKMVEMHT